MVIDKLVGAATAGRRLDTHESYVHRLALEGRLPFCVIDGRRFFNVDDVDALARRREASGRRGGGKVRGAR